MSRYGVMFAELVNPTPNVISGGPVQVTLVSKFETP